MKYTYDEDLSAIVFVEDEKVKTFADFGKIDNGSKNAKIILEALNKNELEIQEVSFQKFKELVAGKEGIVLFGAGGNLQEWIVGVSESLVESDVTKKADWLEAFELTTTGGRTDLALVLGKGFDMGKMPMWRLRFGKCSWISDYLMNYAKQH